jgi:mono/diheme cytochrome c family protein
VKLPTLTRRRAAAACALVVAALAAAGCGGDITVSKEATDLRAGATLFTDRCSGCHSLKAANSYGSAPEGQLKYSERTNGPNFNVRKERAPDVLYAIRNGGFSGAIMPANIVVGRDAQLVADFLAACSGQRPNRPDDCR